MIELAAGTGCGVIVVHMQGTPETMGTNPQYDDVVDEVEEFLLDAAIRLQDAGCDPSRIAIDPGFGFGKRAHHSLTLLAATRRLASHDLPLVLGTSRKGFLTTLTTSQQADKDVLTAITTSLGYTWGARMFRVHDVATSRQALDLTVATEQSR